ncbi:ATP-binding cassette domain-containing protein [Nocardioides zeae]|uniref:ABC transporter ATP-binding protein n=1 Tax=Nocardioides zeae TaxID=1457234 RepID=A0A6P0HHU1_9ACTN|nr:ABC transporter ATP-binding protein [Nocardioides zeae]
MNVATPAIEVRQLRKTYRGTTALDGVDLTVGTGEIFGILGPNGAGKTTTVEIIEGLTSPDSGSVHVLGIDPFADRDALRQVLGAQLQESRLPAKLRVREAVKLYASFYPDPVPVDEMLERVGLTDKRSTPFEGLSGGQQQRLSIALALVGRPKVAILDEVTTGLDPTARRAMWQTILDLRDSGLTVVLITHFMEEAERLCDRVALMRGGRIVATDTTGGIIESTVGGQRVTFDVAGRVPVADLERLPGVTGVEVDGSTVHVLGRGDLVTAITGALHGWGVGYERVRVHQGTLDDAFLQLTGTAAGRTEEDR